MKLLAVFVALILGATAWGEQQPEIPLWANGAPGSEAKKDQALVVIASKSGERSIYQVHNPTITPFIPAKGEANGTAVIVIPGGGHRVLAYDHEGDYVGKALAERGIAAFVLKYRLARETNSTYKIMEHALKDTQRAIRTIRSRAGEWGIKADRIGVMGFSAGGELANHSSLHFDAGDASASDGIDRASSKPNFQALIYPGRSEQILPTTNSPPAFMACGFLDRKDISEGLAQAYLRFKAVNVPCELHVYSTAGHGFGYRPKQATAANAWLTRFEEWLAESKLMPKKL